MNEIYTQAFRGCNRLESIYIPDLKSWFNIDFISEYSGIPESLFRLRYDENNIPHYPILYANGKPVYDLVVPDGVVEIKPAAFSDYNHLLSVRIPNSVTKIGYWAFFNCPNLKSVNLGSGLYSIEDHAFTGCYSCATFIIGSTTVPQYIGDVPLNAFLLVPQGTKENYRNANGWKNFSFISEKSGYGIKITPKNCTVNVKNAEPYDDFYIAQPNSNITIEIIPKLSFTLEKTYYTYSGDEDELEHNWGNDINPIVIKDITGNYDIKPYCSLPDKLSPNWNVQITPLVYGGKNSSEWIVGPFNECSGFRNDAILQFSPHNHNELFVVYDQEPYFGMVAHGMQIIDLKKEEVRNILPMSKFNNQRLRAIDFATDPFAYDEHGNYLGRAKDIWKENDYNDYNKTKWTEHLIVAADNYDSNFRANAVYIVDRDKDGNFSSNSKISPLANYQECTGVAIHPNGDLYFTSYRFGEVVRLDMNSYWNYIEDYFINGDNAGIWDPYVKDNVYGGFKVLYSIQDNGEYQLYIHPSGKYAYIVGVNKACVLRTDYDEETHEFLPPYLVAGALFRTGYVDSVGEKAQLARPYQGVFVRNEKYYEAGLDDEYDFFLCDNSRDRDHTGDPKNEAHALRYIRPDGSVKTAVGAKEDNVFAHNTMNVIGDSYEFDRPTGLAYDEETKSFYIVDTMNRALVKITKTDAAGISERRVLNKECEEQNITHTGVYDLQGRKVANNYSSFVSQPSLPKGIYIVNGKKIVIR